MAATPVTLATSSARSTDGAGSAIDVSDLGATLRLTFDVTAASSGFVAVSIETSEDGVSGWHEVLCNAKMHGQLRFIAAREIQSERLVFVGCDRFVRARWQIPKQGSNHVPSFTFSVAGEAI